MCECNNEGNVKEIVIEGKDWICVILDRDLKQDLAYTTIQYMGALRPWEFVTLLRILASQGKSDK
jgi:hypothetical protein